MSGKDGSRRQANQLAGFLLTHAGGHIRLMLAFSILVNLTILAPSFHMLQVYDRVLTSGSLDTLVALTLIALLALIVYGVAEIARSRLAQRISAVYAVYIARKMFARFERLPQGDQSIGGHLRDFAMVKSFLASRVFVGLFDLPFIPLFVLLLYFVHPLVCALTIVGLIAMLVIGYLNVATTERDRRVGRSAEAEATGFAQGAFCQGDDLRAMGLLPPLLDVWGNKTADALVKAEDAAAGSALYHAMGRTVRQVIQVMTMAMGGWLVINGDMTGGMIFLASMISGRALAPIEHLIGGWETISRSIAAVTGMEAIVGPDKSLRARPVLPEPRGVVEACGLSACDLAGRPVLDGLSLTVEPGQVVAIDGAAASGKSLLIRILAGAIEPQNGEVTVDGIERARWPTGQWGAMVGFFSERTDLLPGALLDNIARFSGQPDMEEVYRAAKSTGAHAAILRQPQGYQTHAMDPMLTLSASQRAQIALARAFYGRPRIVLLDQPTANLDYPAEGMLLNALADAKRGGAAIVMVTRSALLRKLADRRLQISDGRLVAVRSQAPGEPAASAIGTGPLAARQHKVGATS